MFEKELSNSEKFILFFPSVVGATQNISSSINFEVIKEELEKIDKKEETKASAEEVASKKA